MLMKSARLLFRTSLLAAIVMGASSCGGGGESDSSSRGPSTAPPIEITPPGNRAPVVLQQLEDNTVQQGANIRYSRMSQAFSDPDGDRLTLSVSSNDPSFATARLSGDVLIVTGVQAFDTGAVTITVTARDPDGLTATQTFAVRVGASGNGPGAPGNGPGAPGNGAPVVSRQLPDGTVQQGANIRYSRMSQAFSDPDGDRLTLSVSSNDPSFATARLSGDVLIVMGVRAFDTGAVTISVTARDPGGLTATLTFAVRVEAPDNRAPVVSQELEDSTVQQGANIRYSRMSQTFSDPDGDRLTLSVSSNDPSFATARLSGDVLIVTGVRAFDTGAVTITVTARDPGGLTATLTFAVRVTPPPDLWGAISVGNLFPNCANRALGYSYDEPDRRTAIANALSDCRSYLFGGGTSCNDTISWRNSCAAYAAGDRCGGYQAGGDSTRAAAERRALSECARITGNCRVRISLCTSNVR